MIGVSRSQVVELNCSKAVPRFALEKVVRLQRPLVKSSKVEFSPANVATPLFTPVEMRHNFAIWMLKKNGKVAQQRHLYYCVRCKEAFSVNDHSGCVIALDPQGHPIQGNEAARRLATFAYGPCAAFSGLSAGPHLAAKVIAIQNVRGRVARLLITGRRTWVAVVGNFRRLAARSGFQH
jgi:hypothetical protein